MGRITQLVRELRRNQTPAENQLWQELRNRKLKGCKFLRQQPVFYGIGYGGRRLFFVPDFYCAATKLIIELDGKIHDFQKDYDENREEILKSLGLTVLRFKNEELKDIENVKKRITRYL